MGVPFVSPEIRSAGAHLLQEALQSLLGDLLTQGQEKTTTNGSALVVNTLPWERTEVISRPGTGEAVTLGAKDALALFKQVTWEPN